MTNRDPRRTPRKISVLIVDDHPMFREGLQQALSQEEIITVVGECADGIQALQLIQKLHPDVVLLDINLPGMNGLQVARRLKSEFGSTAIVMLTSYHDDVQVLHAMRTGASAYCNKDITPDKLVNIIRSVASGYFVVNGNRLNVQQLEEWINSNIENISGPYMIDSDEHYIPLSPREMEILQYVTQGLSNKEIAAQLGISQQTVKNHMTSILKKLNVQDRTQAAVHALRHGWVRI